VLLVAIIASENDTSPSGPGRSSIVAVCQLMSTMSAEMVTVTVCAEVAPTAANSAPAITLIRMSALISVVLLRHAPWSSTEADPSCPWSHTGMRFVPIVMRVDRTACRLS
jgi:hypothetical protein